MGSQVHGVDTLPRAARTHSRPYQLTLWASRSIVGVWQPWGTPLPQRAQPPSAPNCTKAKAQPYLSSSFFPLARVEASFPAWLFILPLKEQNDSRVFWFPSSTTVEQKQQVACVSPGKGHSMPCMGVGGGKVAGMGVARSTCMSSPRATAT